MRLPPDARLRADVGALLEAAGEAPRDEVLKPILIHLRLLARWNDAYGLTRITEWPQVLDRHIRESVMPLRWIGRTPGRLLDVGSGNGFPALPILACRPRLAGVLLERSERKGLFLEAVLREAGWIQRIRVDATDAEAYVPGHGAHEGAEGKHVTSAADKGRKANDDAAARRSRPGRSNEEPGFGKLSAADSYSAADRPSLAKNDRPSPSETGRPSHTKGDHGSPTESDRPTEGDRSSASRSSAGPSGDLFDWVISRATLAPERFLELAARWVRPGGRVFLFAGGLEPSHGATRRNSKAKDIRASQAARRPLYDDVGGGRRHSGEGSPLRFLAKEPIAGRRTSFLHVYEATTQDTGH